MAVAVAATADALSPKVRRLVRRGAVYGVAGALKASDIVTAAARGVASGVNTQGEGVTSESSPPKVAMPVA